MQVDYDGAIRVVDVPEDSFAVLIKGAGGDHSRNVGSGHSKSMKPSASNLRVRSDTRDMFQWNLEAAGESPELVRAVNVQGEFAFCYR